MGMGGEKGEMNRKCRRLSGVGQMRERKAGHKETSQENQSHTVTANLGSAEMIKTHLNWEKAGEIVSPVIPSSHHDPLLYPILLNGLSIIANLQRR